MSRRHAIDLALDLARMPALARSPVVPPIPPNILDVMRIAAASPQACKAASVATGEPAPVLIEAARFYLQHVLFRPDADCYRILGIQPGASRATARSHMRWLLQWLHPDRNNGWNGAYAERVLAAWREVSAASRYAPEPTLAPAHAGGRRRGSRTSIRLPWIGRPLEGSRGIRRRLAGWAVPASLLIIFLVLSAIYYLDPEKTLAMISLP